MVRYAVKVISAGMGTGVSLGMVVAKFKQEWSAFEYLRQIKRDWPWCKVVREESCDEERKLRLAT